MADLARLQVGVAGLAASCSGSEIRPGTISGRPELRTVARVAEPKLRFAMITTFYPPYNFGGDGAFVRRLSHALAGRGHAVEVIHDADAFRILHKGDDPPTYPSHPA